MAVALKRHRFTLEDYHRMGEAGILTADHRVELIEGEIVEMTAIGPVHASVVARLVSLFVPRLAQRAIVWPQNPLIMAREVSEFQPDLALLRPRVDFYRSANPAPPDALLVVEVMDSSAGKDRGVKLRIYARAGVTEVWLVDVNRDSVEICRAPAGERYGERRVVARDASIAPGAFPDVVLQVAEILGS